MNRTVRCRVSVIVPVYRVEGYLDRCIRSLLKQTLKEIEIICVCEEEDPSYQRLIIYGKKDVRIRVIKKTNTGVSAARNAGMQAAQGEYMTFVDADDWLERHALRFLYNIARRHSAQITVYGLWPSREPGRAGRWVFRCTPRRNVLYRGHGMDALFYEPGSRPFVINKFYNTGFLRKNGLSFEDSLDIGEDQFLQFEAFYRADTICFVKERLYHYEMGRSNSAMNQCIEQQNLQEKNMQLMQRILAYRKEQEGNRHDKGYVWWILLDYAWAVNQKDRRVTGIRQLQIYSIQAQLKELAAEKHVKELPESFQQICRRFLDYSGEAQTGPYLYLPYEELDSCLLKETAGLYENLTLPEKEPAYVRRIYEMAAFHEGSHMMMEMIVWFARWYRKLRAGKKL